MSAPPWALARLQLDGWSALPSSGRIWLALGPYLGWHYTREGTPAPNRLGVAYSTPEIPPALVVAGVDRHINCSTLTASILTAAYPQVGWTTDDYRDIQLARTPFVADAPIRAVERLHIGRRVEDWVIGSFHLVQGWRSLSPPDGHALLVHALADGRLAVVESTSRTDAIGPGVRVSIVTREVFAARYSTIYRAVADDRR